MILSFNCASNEEEDSLVDDSLKIDTINEIEELLSKQSKSKLINFILDIDNILDNNAENIFFKNISSHNKSVSQKSDKSKGKNKLTEYLKKGRFDYSMESNSLSNKEEKPKNEVEQKKQKKKNFILKSELFSPNENDQNIHSEKVSPKTSVLK